MTDPERTPETPYLPANGRDLLRLELALENVLHRADTFEVETSDGRSVSLRRSTAANSLDRVVLNLQRPPQAGAVDIHGEYGLGKDGVLYRRTASRVPASPEAIVAVSAFLAEMIPEARLNA